MNKILVLLIVVASLVYSNCGSGKGNLNDNKVTVRSDTGTSKIIFKEYEHNFGRVAEGEKVACLFEFENSGTSDLVIYSATTTCGCTVPEYSTKPLAPGASGTLEVLFDTSGREGKQTKTITVNSNSKVPVALLTISAEVVTNNN